MQFRTTNLNLSNAPERDAGARSTFYSYSYTVSNRPSRAWIFVSALQATSFFMSKFLRFCPYTNSFNKFTSHIFLLSAFCVPGSMLANQNVWSLLPGRVQSSQSNNCKLCCWLVNHRKEYEMVLRNVFKAEKMLISYFKPTTEERPGISLQTVMFKL